MKSAISSVLMKARGILYSGPVISVSQKMGLTDLLYGPYWSLVYRLSDETVEHTVAGQTIAFRITSIEELKRFYRLAGEEEIVRRILESVEPSDTFYDIGANVGTYTCFAASKLGPGQTVAFEPEPRNVARLQQNLDLNRLDAEILEVALTDTDGTVHLELSGDEVGEGEHAIAASGGENTITVDAARGDSVIDDRGLRPPTVLKIDVEGAELDVLRGMRETLREHCRLVYVEVHVDELERYGGTDPELRTLLEDLGFEVTEIGDRGEHVFLRARKA